MDIGSIKLCYGYSRLSSLDSTCQLVCANSCTSGGSCNANSNRSSRPAASSRLAAMAAAAGGTARSAFYRYACSPVLMNNPAASSKHVRCQHIVIVQAGHLQSPRSTGAAAVTAQ